MTEFARLAAQASTSYSSHGHVTDAQKTAYASLEAEISQGLLRLEELCSQMHDLLSADASSSMQHTLERHRDILQDYSRDFKRTAKSYTEAEQRANLLGSVRSEIDAFKASTSRASGGGRDGDTDQLLGERGHIDSSHRMADDVLGQAYETRHEFQRQRSMLNSVNTRMGGVLGQIPGINSVLNMINARRRRDTLIVGGLIGFLVVLLFLWASR